MDDSAIANPNNFRQLIERIETNYPSKISNYQIAAPVCLSDLNRIENSKDIIIIFDTDGRYIYYNGPTKYNLIEDDIVGMSPSDFFDSETAVKIADRVQGVIRSGKAVKTKSAVKWRGDSLLFLNHTYPIRNAKGLIVAVGSVSHEITERKVSIIERSLDLPTANKSLNAIIGEFKKAEELLRLQRNLAVALSSVSDLKIALGMILDAALQIDGLDAGGVYAVDESSGDLDLILHKGLSEKFIEKFSHCSADSREAQIVKSGDVIYLDHEDILKYSRQDIDEEGIKSLSILPVKYKGVVIADLNLASRNYVRIPSGIRNTLEALAADIAGVIARIKAEEDLRQSEERFRAIFDAAKDSIFIKDTSLCYAQINAAMGRLFNLPASEILGKTDTHLFGKEAVEKIRQSDLRALSGEMIEERQTKRVNGIPMTFHTIKVPMRDKSGKITGLCGIARDITDSSIVENELKRAKEEAEASAQARSEFLANMSHEIRTPMNAVIGITGLLLDTDPTSEQKLLIETIQTSGNALLSIINDILDLTKIDSGKLKLEENTFNLQSCIEDSFELVAQYASEKGLSLSYRVGEDAPGEISGDPMRLRQVMVNLLNNAVKFTEKGEIQLFIDGKNYGNGYELHFKVKDTGIGIPEDKIKNLFQSFSQVDASTTRRYGGTGLGLAISKRLVELMGGRIWVESIPGEGSTFHFTIISGPVDSASAEAKWPSDHYEADLRMKQDRALKVLLAEDNTVNQMVMLRMLEKIGHKADVASNGLEVLHALENSSYDVILMDIQMPEMDGLEAAKEIRKRWPDSGIKIIAITAYALNGDRERCLEAGMDDYISKPVQCGTLAKALKSHQYKRLGKASAGIQSKHNTL